MADILNVVVDLSHHNRVADFNAVTADGIVGIIHKATQGFRFTDPKYQDRRSRALEVGLLWGAYHFGVGGEGSSLACVRPTKREQCRSTAQGWRRCEDSPPPRHADSLAPVYRPERSLRLRAGGRPRLATTPPSR